MVERIKALVHQLSVQPVQVHIREYSKGTHYPPFMKISVIMPSYNQGAFIEKSIRSVLDQQYPDLEFIVMDGGSTDNSVAIIRKYSKDITYWQSGPDGGQSEAINAGMSRATGEICCWLNSDDLLADGALNKVARFFEHNDCQWLVGGGERVSQSGQVTAVVLPKNTSFDGFVDWDNNCINQPSVFWRRELWEKVHGVNTELNCVMDFDLWLRFSKIADAHKMDDILAMTVIHEAMKSNSLAAEMLVEHCLVLYDFGYAALAREKLTHSLTWAFELDQKLQFLNKIPFYKYWRKKTKEKGSDISMK